MMLNWGVITHLEQLGLHLDPTTRSANRKDCCHQPQSHSDCKVLETVQESIQLLTFRKILYHPSQPTEEGTRSSKGGCLHLHRSHWSEHSGRKLKGLLSRRPGSFGPRAWIGESRVPVLLWPWRKPVSPLLSVPVPLCFWSTHYFQGLRNLQ